MISCPGGVNAAVGPETVMTAEGRVRGVATVKSPVSGGAKTHTLNGPGAALGDVLREAGNAATISGDLLKVLGLA